MIKTIAGLQGGHKSSGIVTTSTSIVPSVRSLDKAAAEILQCCEDLSLNEVYIIMLYFAL